MRNERTSRNNLLDWINMCSFAVNEATLFLDVNPDNKEALEYYNKYCRLRKEALEEYAKLYTPLTIDTADNDNQKWEWIENPWPWEYEKGGC